jgi:outer membrane usher protein
MLKAWGVNTAAFPRSQRCQRKPLEDIGRYIPMASSELRFSKLQLHLSIPQAAMSAPRAAGWIRPMG